MNCIGLFTFLNRYLRSSFTAYCSEDPPSFLAWSEDSPSFRTWPYSPIFIIFEAGGSFGCSLRLFLCPIGLMLGLFFIIPSPLKSYFSNERFVLAFSKEVTSFPLTNDWFLTGINLLIPIAMLLLLGMPYIELLFIYFLRLGLCGKLFLKSHLVKVLSLSLMISVISVASFYSRVL